MRVAISFRFGGHNYYKLLDENHSVTFGSHKKDEVYIEKADPHMLRIELANGIVKMHAAGQISSPISKVNTNEVIILSKEPSAILYTSEIVGLAKERVVLPYNGIVNVGRQDDNDIVISFPIISRKHFQLQCENGNIFVEDLNSTNHLYLNGSPIKRSIVKTGDVLSIFTCRFLINSGTLLFENLGSSYRINKNLKIHNGFDSVLSNESTFVNTNINQNSSNSNNQLVKKDIQYWENNFAVKYHLSPRIREELPKEDIVLSPAPAEMKAGGGRRGMAAYMVGSGAMMAASLATGMITPAAVLTRMAGMVSPLANLAMYGKMSKEEKKQLEEYEKLRHEKYEAYISDEKAKIKKVADIQRKIITNENKEPQKCIESVNRLQRNLWERLPQDSDFLSTRIGLGKQKLCVEVKSRAQAQGFKMEEDDDLEMMAERIIEETKYVNDLPICIPLRNVQTLGIIGPKTEIFYLLRSILVEITSQQSALDVHLITLFNSDSKGRWGILRWLPHIWDETGQTRYIAFDPKRIHLICEMLNEVIENRLESEGLASLSKDKEAPLPHYIVIVENRDLIKDENIYQHLITNNQSLGITTIFLSEDLYGLPETTQYLVDMRNDDCIYERSKYNGRKYFKPDEHIHQKELEMFARKMSAIELEGSLNMIAPIPQSVTFLQGNHVKRVEDLNVLDRWENAKPYQTLAAPIGVMEGGKIFSLDVSSGENSHGPHGLLAGTTGSGKSELLQSWILSMAVNYDPRDVNFVIIDYKGGGMADLMEPLPHVVGKITNIDRNIGRSLVSLKSELKRRQRLFAKAGVNNIDKYQRAYKNGDVKTPLPHLIIVTDEFAELKKEEPEFLTELNSVATIGRSLGVHMLLATQRPAGVVTDQINANSRFRICMKVQDAADSREMLKRPDAAKITQAGRAYIRVGEDELFTLFQSFYSGAAYSPDNDAFINENEVKIVDETGNRISAKKRKKSANLHITDELTAVTNYIQNICIQNGIEKMSGPWLPELPKWLTLSDIGVNAEKFKNNWYSEKKSFSVPIGKYDIPAEQAQGIQKINFTDIGHYAVFGIPGSGKTMLLKTLLTSAGVLYSPKNIEITIIDAGGWSLSAFKKMPQVKEVILNQEEEKVDSFILQMTKEMDKRKKLFLKHAVNSLTAYRESVSKDLPVILIAVDQITPMFEAYPSFEEFMNRVAANGAAYGIHLIFTSNSTSGIRYKFLQLIKGVITLQMPDKGDYGNLVGPIAGISIPAFAGRGLIKENPPIAFQTSVCDPEHEDKKQFEDLNNLFVEMDKEFESTDESKIHDNYNKNTMESHDESEQKQYYFDRTFLPIGENTDMMDIEKLDLSKYSQILISSTDPEQLDKYVNDIGKTLATREENQVIYLNDNEDNEEVLENMLAIAEERSHNPKLHKKDNSSVLSEEYQQICLIVPNIMKFSSSITAEQRQKWRRLFLKANTLGFVIVVSELKENLMRSEIDVLTDCVMEFDCMIFLNNRISDYLFCDFDIDAENLGVQLKEDEIALIRDGLPVILKKENFYEN